MRQSARPCTGTLLATGVLVLAMAVGPALGYVFTLNLSAPPTAVVGQPIVVQAIGTNPPPADYPFLTWLTVATVPATVASSCPTSYIDALQLAPRVGGVGTEVGYAIGATSSYVASVLAWKA